MFSPIRNILLILLTICIFGSGFAVGKYIFPNQREIQTVTKISPTVILEKIKNISKLETIEMILQRDIEIALDLGNFDIFGFSLEKKRTQKIALTGKVVAGTDLSELKKEDIIVDASNKITINLPAPKILYTELDQEKTQLLKDDLTPLFRIENISDSKRIELNELLRKQVSKQAKIALFDGACRSDILAKAGENTKAEVARIFTFAQINGIEINVKGVSNCVNPELSDTEG